MSRLIALTLSRKSAGDSCARQQELDGLLAPDSRRDARKPLFFLERSANGGRRSPGALRVAGGFLVELIRRRVKTLLRRQLVEVERARRGFNGSVALALPERLPVDARLPRI